MDRWWLSRGRERSARIAEALPEVESFWSFLRPAGQGKEAGGRLEPELAQLQGAAFGHTGPWCGARPGPGGPGRGMLAWLGRSR